MKNNTAKTNVYQLAYCAIFTTLIAVGAFIRIPIPVVPFTLQTFFILMAGLILGGRCGALSCLLYMLLGLAGLPVFTQGGGLWYLLKPSFGYIIGFCFGSYAAGKLADGRKLAGGGKLTDGRKLAGGGKSQTMKCLLTACFLGLAIVYAIGMVYYFIICNYVIHTPLGLWPLFLHCFLLVAPGDICLCFLAAALTKRMRPALSRFMQRV